MSSPSPSTLNPTMKLRQGSIGARQSKLSVVLRTSPLHRPPMSLPEDLEDAVLGLEPYFLLTHG